LRKGVTASAWKKNTYGMIKRREWGKGLKRTREDK